MVLGITKIQRFNRIRAIQAIEFHLYHKEKSFAKENRPLLDENNRKVKCKNGIERL